MTPDPSHFPKPGYSPYANRNYPKQVFWRDEHPHTSWPGDAGPTGTTLGPEEALRFARGEQVISNAGQPFGISRSSATALLNGEIGYQISGKLRISAEFLDLLNRRNHNYEWRRRRN